MMDSFDIVGRWLYARFVAIDANFRLKRKHVSNNVTDPSLSRGWAYFVEDSQFLSFLNEHHHEAQEVRASYSILLSIQYFPEKYLFEPQRRQHGQFQVQPWACLYRSWLYRLRAP